MPLYCFPQCSSTPMTTLYHINTTAAVQIKLKIPPFCFTSFLRHHKSRNQSDQTSPARRKPILIQIAAETCSLLNFLEVPTSKSSGHSCASASRAFHLIDIHSSGGQNLPVLYLPAATGPRTLPERRPESSTAARHTSPATELLRGTYPSLPLLTIFTSK